MKLGWTEMEVVGADSSSVEKGMIRGSARSGFLLLKYVLLRNHQNQGIDWAGFTFTVLPYSKNSIKLGSLRQFIASWTGFASFFVKV